MRRAKLTLGAIVESCGEGEGTTILVLMGPVQFRNSAERLRRVGSKLLPTRSASVGVPEGMSRLRRVCAVSAWPVRSRLGPLPVLSPSRAPPRPVPAALALPSTLVPVSAFHSLAQSRAPFSSSHCTRPSWPSPTPRPPRLLPLTLARAFHSSPPQRDIFFVTIPVFKQALLTLVRVTCVPSSLSLLSPTPLTPRETGPD